MSESSSLPLFSTAVDPGPSFADVLRQVAPHQLPGAGITGPSTLEIPHGTTVVAIRFAGGGLATLAASTALTPGLGSRVQVTGRTGATAGLAEYPEGSEARIDLWAIPGAETVTDPFGGGLTTDLDLATINNSLAPFHALQIADFVAAVRERREPVVTGREAAKSLAILTALYTSAASGRPEPVRYLPERPELPQRG